MLSLFASIVISMIVLSITTQHGYAVYFGNDFTVTNHKETPSSSLVLFPKQLTATEKGDVYVVWADKNRIHISTSHENENEKNFEDKVLLSQVNKLTLFPQLAATEKGNVYVVWVDIDNKTGESNIEFTSSNDSGKTFTPQKELRGGKSISSFPQLAATEKGNVYVVWINKNDKTRDSYIEFTSSNDSGISFSSRKKLIGGKSMSFFPQLAATEKGDVYLVWVNKSNKTGDTDIIFRSSNDSGTSFGVRKKLTRSQSISSFSPQIAATEKGDVYLVWADRDNTSGDSDISFRSSNNRGKIFQGILNLNSGENGVSHSSLPQIASVQNDTVYVVWMDNQIQFKEILVKDAIVGKLISLSNRTTSSLSPEITATKNGDIFVLWIDKNSMVDRSLHLKRISENYFNRNS